MKKIVSVILACSLCFALFGCGKSTPSDQDGNANNPSSITDNRDPNRDNSQSEKDSSSQGTSSNTSSLTTGQKNALKSAQSYLRYSAFSYSGLISQLEYEGYSTEDSTYAVDNCGADWSEQAAKCAKQYLDYSSFSRDGLIEQLEYEGFTYDQAVYGVEQNGY